MRRQSAVPDQERPVKERPAKEKPAEPARPYHHGQLKKALVDAALELAEEVGAEGVTVREAARRAGVSPGAPFRHFADREALMTAVAAEALRRFRHEVDAALSGVPADEPLTRFRAIGLAYIRWALRNPAHFHIFSTSGLFDLERSAALKHDTAELIDMTGQALAEAASRGLLASGDTGLIQIAGRALVYGFARMVIDGHLPRWNVDPAEAPRIAEGIIDLFMGMIAKAER